MIWRWLHGRLVGDEIEALRARVDYLEAWVRGLDAALWRVDQQTQANPDMKALAGKIRAQMMQAKKAFPTRMEDVR